MIVHAEEMSKVVSGEIGISQEKLTVIPHIYLGEEGEQDTPVDGDPNMILFFGQNTGSNSLAFARLESCGTGNSGDVATVKAQAGGVFSNTVEVEFGGDPASCSIPDFAEDLDIGDNAAFTATFVDELGNKIPDGIVAHIVEVDSGDGADNVDIVSETEDTVNSQVTGNVIGAISGLTTIAEQHLSSYY